MKRRTRRILFLIATITFLTASYVALLYAQGYRYSFKEHQFFRTGAIYLKVNESAKVFVDDELAGSTGFLGNTFDINRLLPGEYHIQIQRPNFSTWEKKIAVQEGMVSAFPRVLLLPQIGDEVAELVTIIEQYFNDPERVGYPTPIPTITPSRTPTPRTSPRTSVSPRGSITPAPTPSFSPAIFRDPIGFDAGKLYRRVDGEYTVLAEKVKGFALSEDRKKVLWHNDHEIWVAWLDDIDYQPYHRDGDIEMILFFATPITRAVWFDEDHIVVDSKGYKVIETDTRGGVNIIKL